MIVRREQDGSGACSFPCSSAQGTGVELGTGRYARLSQHRKVRKAASKIGTFLQDQFFDDPAMRDPDQGEMFQPQLADAEAFGESLPTVEKTAQPEAILEVRARSAEFPEPSPCIGVGKRLAKNRPGMDAPVDLQGLDHWPEALGIVHEEPGGSSHPIPVALRRQGRHRHCQIQGSSWGEAVGLEGADLFFGRQACEFPGQEGWPVNPRPNGELGV